MDSLQIQDGFQPYYATNPDRFEPARSEAPPEREKANKAEMRKRLERCRARLARALAAEGVRG